MIPRPSKRTRGEALQEAFFYKMDQELIELLGRQLQREEKLRSFAQATGIRDENRLKMLIDSGFEVPTLTAFMWVPLVFVAWADGRADELEKKSIIDILISKGISRQTAEMMIHHEWFCKSPTDELWQIWEEFTASTLVSLSPSVRNELIDEIVGLCHVVAHASGGFLGIGTVSQAETVVIDRIVESLHRCSAVAQPGSEFAV